MTGGNNNNHLVATYSCEEGYSINGPDAVRACGVLGDWRGSPPTCRRENFCIRARGGL